MNQREIIQQEAEQAIAPHFRCGVAISMGVGKTLIALHHMDKHYQKGKRRFLVVAPKLSILTSWKDDAKKFGFEHLLPFIKFSTYLSFTKLIPGDYDVLYLDECHSLLYTHELWLRAYPGAILGLTGTKPRYEYSEKGKIMNEFCPIVYNYKTDEAVESKILNDYRIFIHPLSLDVRQNFEIKTKNLSFYSSEKKSYDYWSQQIENAIGPEQEQKARLMRMHNMMKFPSKVHYAAELLKTFTHKSIVFMNTQEQADWILPNSYHTKNKNSEANLAGFKNGTIDKLSCVMALNEGVNIPDLKECIILHAYANERKASQRIGRMLRLNPNDVATIHILMFSNSIDETWVKRALENLDPTKIFYHGFSNN